MRSERGSSLLFIYLRLNIANHFTKTSSQIMLRFNAPLEDYANDCYLMLRVFFTHIHSSFQRLYHIWSRSFYNSHLTMRGICAMQWRFVQLVAQASGLQVCWYLCRCTGRTEHTLLLAQELALAVGVDCKLHAKIKEACNWIQSGNWNRGIYGEGTPFHEPNLSTRAGHVPLPPRHYYNAKQTLWIQRRHVPWT